MECANDLKGGGGLMSIRSTILLAIEKVAKEQDRKLAPLTDDLPILESGLDSLALAVLVARLEDELNVDPFTESSFSPVTVGDLIAAYERVGETNNALPSN